MVVKYSQLHYFQPFAGTCFRDLCLHLQPYSNCQIPLLVFRCQLFNGFMYFEIKFFSSGISKLKMVFLFFCMKIFSQIVSSKGFSACFNNLASFLD